MMPLPAMLQTAGHRSGPLYRAVGTALISRATSSILFPSISLPVRIPGLGERKTSSSSFTPCGFHGPHPGRSHGRSLVSRLDADLHRDQIGIVLGECIDKYNLYGVITCHLRSNLKTQLHAVLAKEGVAAVRERFVAKRHGRRGARS